ncbi:MULTISPECIES: hypothetical protein [unclassified Phenylobacterium]|uniref:hypothetical protein n=1 Tax=unclassified Phenylobacterium TaxID=2640670 RepID=UPI00083AE080|nr:MULTISPECIES: hypothetical protein [unclassified Phenylobacterium]
MDRVARPRLDHQPPLRLAQATWDRESPEGRRRLVHEASLFGLPFVFVTDSGDQAAPADDVAAW